VSQGQLYQSGDAGYDAFFSSVHDLQDATTHWPEDKRAARRPLLDALKLDMDAEDATVAQLAHERAAAATPTVGAARLTIEGANATVVAPNDTKADSDLKVLFGAIESTMKAELARAKSLRGVASKADELAHRGKDLEPRVDGTFAQQGGQKPSEVKRELGASEEALTKLAQNAKREADAATYFVDDIQRAIDASGGIGAPPPAPSASASAQPSAKHGDKASSAPPPPLPPPKPTATEPAPPPKRPPPPPPRPAPKPTPKEVFNP
jgi:hypothetical protein